MIASISTGSPAHLQPFFSHAPLASILLTLQIVPYFMTGFESVPKVAEEANPNFPPKDFFKAIAMALLVGAGFYVLRRRRYFLSLRLGRAFLESDLLPPSRLSRAPIPGLDGAAHPCHFLVALIQVFNGNFVASSRLIFAFGRRGTLHPSFATRSRAISHSNGGDFGGDCGHTNWFAAGRLYSCSDY